MRRVLRTATGLAKPLARHQSTQRCTCLRSSRMFPGRVALPVNACCRLDGEAKHVALPLTSVASTNPDRCALFGAARASCCNRHASGPLLRAAAALRSCLAITCKPLTYCRHDSQRFALMHRGMLQCTALHHPAACCAVQCRAALFAPGAMLPPGNVSKQT